MLKKLYDKDEIWFAVGWIILYVLAFGNADSISESIGISKVLTVPVGLALCAILYGFVRKHDLFHHMDRFHIAAAAIGMGADRMYHCLRCIDFRKKFRCLFAVLLREHFKVHIVKQAAELPELCFLSVAQCFRKISHNALHG